MARRPSTGALRPHSILSADSTCYLFSLRFLPGKQSTQLHVTTALTQLSIPGNAKRPCLHVDGGQRALWGATNFANCTTKQFLDVEEEASEASELRNRDIQIIKWSPQILPCEQSLCEEKKTLCSQGTQESAAKFLHFIKTPLPWPCCIAHTCVCRCTSLSLLHSFISALEHYSPIIQVNALVNGVQTNQSIPEILDTLASITAPAGNGSGRASGAYGGDLKLSIQILASLSTFISEGGNGRSFNVQENQEKFLLVASNLLRENNTKSWLQLDKVRPVPLP